MSELMKHIATIQDMVEKVSTELIFMKTEVWELENTLKAREVRIDELTDAMADTEGGAQ